MLRLRQNLEIAPTTLPVAQNRAIHLNGTTYLQSFGPEVPYPQSAGVTFSFWFASPGTGTQTFFDSLHTSGPLPVVSVSKLNIGSARRPDMRLFAAFSASGSLTAPNKGFVSAASLPLDNAPHHVVVSVNTSTGQSIHNIDGIPYGWDPAHSNASGGPFLIPYVDANLNANEWLIGATISSNGGLTQFLIGDIGELYYFNGPSAFDYSSGPGLQGGFAQQFLVNGVRKAFGPVELGPEGMGVMPIGQVRPIICCRGGYPEFLENHGGTTSFISVGGTPTTSADAQDPWQLWP